MILNKDKSGTENGRFFLCVDFIAGAFTTGRAKGVSRGAQPSARGAPLADEGFSAGGKSLTP